MAGTTPSATGRILMAVGSYIALAGSVPAQVAGLLMGGPWICVGPVVLGAGLFIMFWGHRRFVREAKARHDGGI